jgi:hypothetical protein
MRGRFIRFEYEETPAFQITRRFLNDHEAFVEELVRPEPGLFDEVPRRKK